MRKTPASPAQSKEVVIAIRALYTAWWRLAAIFNRFPSVASDDDETEALQLEMILLAAGAEAAKVIGNALAVLEEAGLYFPHTEADSSDDPCGDAYRVMAHAGNDVVRAARAAAAGSRKPEVHHG